MYDAFYPGQVWLDTNGNRIQAHGGSLIFYSSLCKAMEKGRVIGIDIEIRPHNRAAIEAHPVEFVAEFFTSPVSMVLLALLALTILSQTRYWTRIVGLVRRFGVPASS